MQEILYKAKRADTKKWVQGYIVRPHRRDDEGNVIMWVFNALDEKGWVSECVVDAETVCQYIGLPDAHKEKLWEHDIIHIPGEDEHFHLQWDKDSARFAMISESLIVDFDNYWSYEVEAVGNIFDNPELMECSAE